MGQVNDGSRQGLSRVERRRLILQGLGRALLATVVLVATYFAIPVEWLDNLHLALVLILGPPILLGVAIWQLLAVMRSPHPDVRSIEALAVTSPLYLLLCAVTYLVLAFDDPASFTVDTLTRVDALYFTVTVFSTVGFGDISAATEPARVLVTIQMILNLIFLGAGVRLLTAAVHSGRKSQDRDAVSGPPTDA